MIKDDQFLVRSAVILSIGFVFTFISMGMIDNSTVENKALNETPALPTERAVVREIGMNEDIEYSPEDVYGKTFSVPDITDLPESGE